MITHRLDHSRDCTLCGLPARDLALVADSVSVLHPWARLADVTCEDCIAKAVADLLDSPADDLDVLKRRLTSSLEQSLGAPFEGMQMSPRLLEQARKVIIDELDKTHGVDQFEVESVEAGPDNQLIVKTKLRVPTDFIRIEATIEDEK